MKFYDKKARYHETYVGAVLTDVKDKVTDTVDGVVSEIKRGFSKKNKKTEEKAEEDPAKPQPIGLDLDEPVTEVKEEQHEVEYVLDYIHMELLARDKVTGDVIAKTQIPPTLDTSILRDLRDIKFNGHVPEDIGKDITVDPKADVIIHDDTDDQPPPVVASGTGVG